MLHGYRLVRPAVFAGLALFLMGALAPASAEQVSGTFESGVDRPGGDYRSIDLGSDEATACFSACAKDDQCMAWTYTKPGVLGDNAQCTLKNAVNPGAADPCCTSGVMARAGIDPETVVPAANQSGEPHPWDNVRADGRWCADDLIAAGHKPLFVQTGAGVDNTYVFTDPLNKGYVGIAGCNQVTWNWIAFHQAWVERDLSYPSAEEDPIYSKKIVYEHLETGNQVTIAYFR